MVFMFWCLVYLHSRTLMLLPIHSRSSIIVSTTCMILGDIFLTFVEWDVCLYDGHVWPTFDSWDYLDLFFFSSKCFLENTLICTWFSRALSETIGLCLKVMVYTAVGHPRFQTAFSFWWWSSTIYWEVGILSAISFECFERMATLPSRLAIRCRFSDWDSSRKHVRLLRVQWRVPRADYSAVKPWGSSFLLALLVCSWQDSASHAVRRLDRVQILQWPSYIYSTFPCFEKLDFLYLIQFWKVLHLCALMLQIYLGFYIFWSYFVQHGVVDQHIWSAFIYVCDWHIIVNVQVTLPLIMCIVINV